MLNKPLVESIANLFDKVPYDSIQDDPVLLEVYNVLIDAGYLELEYGCIYSVVG